MNAVNTANGFNSIANVSWNWFSVEPIVSFGLLRPVDPWMKAGSDVCEGNVYEPVMNL